MNPQEIELVKSSFAKVAPIADAAAVIFYDELFERDPKLRSLFAEDMTEQRRKLMMMLGTAVNGLDDWGSVAGHVSTLGERHVSYGVTSDDYDTVGAALIETLSKGLGDEFTPDVREAWIACYTVVSGAMLDAAESASVA
jgi:hemoglobin-like flavoprotein